MLALHASSSKRLLAASALHYRTRHLSQGNSKIKRTTPEGVVTCFAGGGPGFCDGVGSAAIFASPYALCAWRGRLLVADTGNHAVREAELSSGAVRTLAGHTGSAGYSNDLEATGLG